MDALQSYKILPEQDNLGAETIRGKLSGTDRDSILVSTWCLDRGY